MAKTIVKAFVFAFLFVIAYYIFQMAWGYYLTMKYTPDILQAYSANEQLSGKVSFGIAASTPELIIQMVSILAMGVAVFLLCSFFLKKLRNE